MDPIVRSQLQYALFHAFDYKVYEQAVADFHESDARTQIISCPARTSKSYSAEKSALPDVIYPGLVNKETRGGESMLCWVVAPNYDLAKEFDYFYRDLVEKRQTIGFDYRLEKHFNSPKQGNMEICIDWGKNRKGETVTSRIVTKSATNERSLQSDEVDVAILSEAARLDPIVWSKYLSNRCGRSIWPTTPDIQAAWIWEQIELSKNHPELGIESFNFTGRANPKYNWLRYWTEHAKAESLITGDITIVPDDPSKAPSAHNGHNCFDSLIACPAMKQDGFAEQFGGKWVFHRGRVVPLRERETEAGAPAHVISHDPAWASHAIWTVSCDYGFVDNAVAGFWMCGPDNTVILRREVYQSGLTADQFVDKIEEEWDWISSHFADPSIYPPGQYVPQLPRRAHRYIGDPKKPEVEALFRRAGLPIWNVNKNAQADRNAGHQQLMGYLATDPRTGLPSMFVHEDCKSIINEWRTLRRNDRVGNEGSANSLIGADDGYDMARYFVQTRPSGREAPTLASSDFERARRLVLRTRARTPAKATVPRGMQSVAWT